MTRARLDEICQEHGVKVDFERQGAGKFVDLYIGTGADYRTLTAVRDALRTESGMSNLIIIDHVDNHQHEDYGKAFVNVGSFWNV